MESYFKDLKDKGYYVRKQKGCYNGKIFTEYELTKNNPDEDSRIINCWLNKKAVELLIDRFGFKIVKVKKSCFHGSCPFALRFSTQTKEPLMLN